MPGGLGVGGPPPPPPAGAASRLARHAYSKKAAVSVYAQLKKANALGLPAGVDRSDPGLFAEPGQVGRLGLPTVAHRPALLCMPAPVPAAAEGGACLDMLCGMLDCCKPARSAVRAFPWPMPDELLTAAEHLG